MISTRHLIACLFAQLVVLAAGCGKQEQEMRRYSEVVIAPPQRASSAMPDLPPAARGAPLSLAWETPEGWVEKPGGGMRIATFLVGDDKIECTVASFPGDVGGTDANIRRWAGQLNMALTDEQIRTLRDRSEKLETAGGYRGILVDFDELALALHTPSMLAALIGAGDQTVFIKLMGPRGLLADEKQKFVSLCRSLKPGT